MKSASDELIYHGYYTFILIYVQLFAHNGVWGCYADTNSVSERILNSFTL
jgi:hypothetical protein